MEKYFDYSLYFINFADVFRAWAHTLSYKYQKNTYLTPE